MDKERLIELEGIYKNGLLHDTLPFWINHSVDKKNGGFYNALGQDGAVIDTDKAVWPQGRFTWLLSTLYNRVDARKEWLELARHGIEFIDRHGFDRDGRMFFLLNKEGRPIRKRRYIFSEAFACMAYAAYSKASGEEWAARKATGLWELMLHYLHTPGLLPPKLTENRQTKGLAVPMILIGVAQELRLNIGDHGYSETIDTIIGKIRSHWMKPEYAAVMETVGPEGEFIDHFDGRILNPGHSIELAWFLMREAEFRKNDPEILTTALSILDWMWEWGWDKEYGGIIYYRDVKGFPPQEYWHDMKFWWPQNEAIIATLMAYRLTGNGKYADWHSSIHNWAYKHFPDREHGEWFGYLHRDGRISNPAKGNIWKGPFHLPRMQMVCSGECRKMLSVF